MTCRTGSDNRVGRRALTRRPAVGPSVSPSFGDDQFDVRLKYLASGGA
jgi:hypothetical protein